MQPGIFFNRIQYISFPVPVGTELNPLFYGTKSPHVTY